MIYGNWQLYPAGGCAKQLKDKITNATKIDKFNLFIQINLVIVEQIYEFKTYNKFIWLHFTLHIKIINKKEHITKIILCALYLNNKLFMINKYQIIFALVFSFHQVF